jgi:glycosyltransferase involved in cell wall biosynthesis
MRILVLHSRYRSGSASGENRVVEDEARLLSEAGHAVQVYSPGAGRPSGMELVRTGARVVWSRRAASEVRRHMSRLRPDVVHCHNLYPALSPSVLRAIAGRASLVMTLHNYRLLCLPGIFFRDGRPCEDCLGRLPWPGVLHSCYQGSVPASLALATSLTIHRRLGSFDGVDRYLAISEFVRTKHIQAGLPSQRVVVKPHFTWPGKVRGGAGDYFLYLGRLSPEKGVDTLIDAWRGIDERLLVVGNGPEASSLRSKAPAHVEFVPTVSPERVRTLIQSARAMLVPSRSDEGAGRVVLEAYAAGVPVIASRVGALPEVVVENTTGLLVAAGNVSAWVEAVQRLLEDAESERMGRAGLQLWEAEYSPARGLARLEAAYHSAMAEARTP